ncbi:type II toxin-antitoxin system Phd/YefM family antitoxin [Angustibacter sp. Root456]|uniref:type II toxin-antitoxin system Phd/YefM family antitoxin n=1 Tax=Angustibacter sp. Root456 TaxID=1736539 RepID=UPI000700ACAC|nr:type II toxin-antitoxin system Phd/YefM family antitoxin [Angustibacter sp. Root456]KQX69368.1 hypothetical protein ASD06_16680 [Angustibacter sp. Root456]
MTETSITDAKARLGDLVQRAETAGERTIITRYGRPVAVLISVDELESIEETMYWLPHLDEVRQAEREPRVSLSKEQLLHEIHSRAERGQV